MICIRPTREVNLTITLRPAQATDQATIKAMVRAERLNPMGLHWQNFLVAEQAATIGQDAAAIVGIGQLRPHGDGVLELASLVVVESSQGQGVGTLLVHALILRAGGPLYLMCDARLVPYYTRFGFVRLTRLADMPPPLRRLYRIGNWLTPLIRLITREEHAINIMAHPGPGSSVNPSPDQDLHSALHR